MSLLDGLFGAGAQQAILGQYQIDPAEAARQRALQAQYSSYQQARFNQTSQWVFNGKPCTLQEFADAIWPGEHEDKMLFILTHAGPKQK